MYNGKLENITFTFLMYQFNLHPINELKKIKQTYKQCSFAIIMFNDALYLKCITVSVYMEVYQLSI